MGVILTRKSTSSSSASGGGSGVYTSAEKLAIELEMEFKAANDSYYKELSYTDGSLTNIGIYLDDTKVFKLFNKDLTYSSGALSQVLLERISDSAKLLKILEYDVNDNLTSVTVSAG
jgi:hypothetical protein